jgi:hypothetical protein
VIEQHDAYPNVAYVTDQNGKTMFRFRINPASPVQIRKTREWLLTALNEMWNKEQSIAAIGRAFSGEKP